MKTRVLLGTLFFILMCSSIWGMAGFLYLNMYAKAFLEGMFTLLFAYSFSKQLPAKL